MENNHVDSKYTNKFISLRYSSSGKFHMFWKTYEVHKQGF